MSQFVETAASAEIAKLQWEYAKQRVNRNRKLVRKYHALEVPPSPHTSCAQAVHWQRSKSGSPRTPACRGGDPQLHAIASVNERVKRIREENLQISVSASQR